MSPDLLVGTAALAVLFVLEGLVPFYPDRRGRLAHAGRNLALAVVSGTVGALLMPLLVLAMGVAAQSGFGLTRWLALSPAWSGLVAFLLFDLWMYLWHRLNHRVPLLWRLHRVHHTDPAMDCTTALRFHPGEILLSTLANAVVLLLIGAALPVFIGYRAVMVVIIACHHANIALPEHVDRALRQVIVTPALHRVHHSEVPAETNANYGTIFSFWDHWFGTWRLRADQAAIRFGIGRWGEPDWQGPRRLLLLPLLPDSGPTR